MWQCPKCGESVEAPLDVCWNCGTSTEGVEDPDFLRVGEMEAMPSPTCEDCGAPVDQSTLFRLPYELCPACAWERKIEAEPRRSCPVDGTVMLKETILDVIVDRCPACEGVWFDAGEFERLMRWNNE